MRARRRAALFSSRATGMKAELLTGTYMNVEAGGGSFIVSHGCELFNSPIFYV